MAGAIASVIKVASLGVRVVQRVFMMLVRFRFRRCGRRVIFSPFDDFSYSRISIGEHVFIGAGAVFNASNSAISIGNKVMFGPGVMIMGGDHNTSEIGEYMIDVKAKRPGDDLPVTIEDDVWIGARAIILKGVTIGRGAIVGAGSVVTRSVPEYAVAVGVPARIVKTRFDAQQLELHTRLLSDKAG